MRKLFASSRSVLIERRDSEKKSFFMPYLVCGLAALFYLYEYILQVSPSVMTTELMRDLNINAVGIGTMAAFYFYAYSPMQLPAGLLYDRFGPRRMITAAVLVCSLGAFFFAMTTNLHLASAGRFFMGIGSAFSFIGALVLIARWFPPKYFAFLAGIAQLMSSVGAMIGKMPIAYWISATNWRDVMLWLGIAGVLLGLFVWLFVRDYPEQRQSVSSSNVSSKDEFSSEWKRLGAVCKNSQTWAVGIYAFAIWAPIAIFATTWDVLYLRSVHPYLDVPTASSITSMVWLGIGVGSPLLGWWSDHIGRRCLPLTLSAVLGVFASIVLLYFPHYLSIPSLYVLMFLFGAAASGQSACFGVVQDINKPNVVGTAVGFNNMAVLLGGVIFQPLVGYLLQASWDGQMLNGVTVYTHLHYQKALFVLPLCFILASVVSTFFMKETHCRPSYLPSHHS